MLEEVPDLFGQVSQFVKDLPLIKHVAQLHHFVINEGLFVIGERGELNVGEFFPVRTAGEQVGFEPGGARLDGFAFGIANGRHDFAQRVVDRFGDELLAQVHVVEHGNAGGEQNQGNGMEQPGSEEAAEQPHNNENGTANASADLLIEEGHQRGN